MAVGLTHECAPAAEWRADGLCASQVPTSCVGVASKVRHEEYGLGWRGVGRKLGLYKDKKHSERSSAHETRDMRKPKSRCEVEETCVVG